MTERPPVRVWTRLHKNGMLAVVHAIPSRPKRFAFGALLPGGHGSLGELNGFAEAKAAADRVSTCEQPCDCPPWND